LEAGSLVTEIVAQGEPYRLEFVDDDPSDDEHEGEQHHDADVADGRDASSVSIGSASEAEGRNLYFDFEELDRLEKSRPKDRAPASSEAVPESRVARLEDLARQHETDSRNRFVAAGFRASLEERVSRLETWLARNEMFKKLEAERTRQRDEHAAQTDENKKRENDDYKPDCRCRWTTWCDRQRCCERLG
jgi:hypothetical protein